MKIALIVNTEKQGALHIARAAAQRLIDFGAELYSSSEGIGATVTEEESLFTLCDVVVTVGGDGTIIRYAKKAAEHNKAVLGINAGRLGFLAEIEKEDIDSLCALVSGSYTVSERFMLKARVYENDRLIAEDTALNDAVLSAGSIANLLDFEVRVAGGVIDYRSDGVIVSTPTGSTAYSMSAGGPIVDPDMRCFVMTPICSHSLTARPMIVGEESKIELSLPKDSSDSAIFSLDGRFCCNVDKNVRIEITRSEITAKLISLKDSSFYNTLSKKFRR